jgi:drug/metabolite transporter (DMT)-like permease
MIWTRRRAMLVLVACNLMWAGTYTAGKEALVALTPIELNALRFAIAGITMLPLLWRQRGTLRLDRGHVKRLALLCLCGFVLNKAFEFTGLKLSTASDNSLLIASESMFTVALGWVLLKERVHRGAVMGLVVSILGAYLVIERGVVLPRLGGGGRIAGDLLIVLALFFEALYTVLGKAELRRYPALGITAVCVISSLIVWIPAAAANIAVSGMPSMTGRAWIGVFYLAVVATTVAYIGWIAALRYVDAAAAAPTLFLQPLFGTVLAVLILGERVVWATVAGGALIIVGIWIVSRSSDASEPPVLPAEVGIVEALP